MTAVDGIQTGSRYKRQRPAQPGAAVPSSDTASVYEGAPAVPTSPLLLFIGAAFLVSLAIPVIFNIGPFRMSPYRLILVLTFLPFLGSLIAGKCGKITVTDVLLGGFAFWSLLATIVHEGTGALSFAGISTIETFGAYLVARHCIRNLDDFLRFGKIMFYMLLVFVPFAAMESFTDEPVYIKMFKIFGRTIAHAGNDPRLGLDRAQVAFEHPILYGIFASTTLSLLYFAPRKSKPGVAGFRKAWASVVATFFSLSSGAFIPVVVQTGLIAWNTVLRIFKWRWKLFVALVVMAYLTIELGSNRNAFRVFADYLAFNSGNSYWRVLIFNYGIQNVWDNPIFGFGLGNDWVRPSWMFTSTVDNFWLVIAMRYGIPGFLLFAGAYLSVILRLVFAKNLSEVENNQRYALVFIAVSVVIAISTVWLWNATYVYLMFILGSGAWLSEVKPKTAVSNTNDEQVDASGAGGAQPRILRNRNALQEKPSRDRSAAPSAKPREVIRYSRVEPRRAKDVSDQGDPDKRH